MPSEESKLKNLEVLEKTGRASSYGALSGIAPEIFRAVEITISEVTLRELDESCLQQHCCRSEFVQVLVAAAMREAGRGPRA